MRPTADEPLLNPSTWAGALRLLAVSAGFWALAALMIQQVLPAAESLPRLLVLTECAGLTMTLGYLLLRGASPIWRLGALVRGILLALLAVAGGYIAGQAIALLLGEPLLLGARGPYGLVPIVVATLVAGLGLHYFATREQLASEAAARSEAQRLAVESHLRLLHTQLEPHMLFNTLANLRSLLREDPAAAERMIDQLITYLRGTLAASRAPWTTLGVEFAQLRAYLQIMATRLGSRMDWQLDLPADLEQVAVAPMLLQPLVENAIRHGIEPQVGPASIEVAAREVDGAIVISVSNTGPDLPAAPPVPRSESGHAGYGLQHVRERLLALYGEGASLSLGPRQPSGVCAMVRFPKGGTP